MGKGKALPPNWRKIDSTKVRINSALQEIHLEMIEHKEKNGCKKCRQKVPVCDTCLCCFDKSCNYGCPWHNRNKKEE